MTKKGKLIEKFCLPPPPAQFLNPGDTTDAPRMTRFGAQLGAHGS